MKSREEVSKLEDDWWGGVQVDGTRAQVEGLGLRLVGRRNTGESIRDPHRRLAGNSDVSS